MVLLWVAIIGFLSIGFYAIDKAQEKVGNLVGGLEERAAIRRENKE